MSIKTTILKLNTFLKYDIMKFFHILANILIMQTGSLKIENYIKAQRMQLFSNSTLLFKKFCVVCQKSK